MGIKGAMDEVQAYRGTKMLEHTGLQMEVICQWFSTFSVIRFGYMNSLSCTLQLILCQMG